MEMGEKRAGGHEREWVRRVWVQGDRWKWVGRRTGGHVDALAWADCVGAREKVEMGGEKDRWA